MNRSAVKPVIGLVIGIGLAVAANAASSTSSWFSALFSTGGANAAIPDQNLLAQTDAAMQSQLTADASDCADTGIGAAIKTAVDVHTQMASATPQVESLFDPSIDCFPSINQIIDLSFSIPSLGSILSAAESAVVQYAQKQVCTAVNQATGMVTTPINQAIDQINRLQGFTAVNGMGAGTVPKIDTNLGAQYHPAVASDTFTVKSPFATSQTSFQASSLGTPPSPTSPAPAQPARQSEQADSSWWSSVTAILR